MSKNTVSIEYTHTVKALLGNSTTTERCFFWLDGFHVDTLAGEPSRFEKAAQAIIKDMAKCNDTWGTYFDTKSDVDGRTIRIIVKNTGWDEKGRAIPEFSYIVFERQNWDERKATKKEILDLLKTFFIECMVSLNAKKTA